MSIRLRPGPALLTAVSCLLLAANLRPGLTAVGPLVGDVRASTGMSAAVAGALTTVPLIAFAVISPLAPAVARRFGATRAVSASMAVLAAGLLMRSAGASAAMFAGTMVIGAAIAIGNVLLPALVKQDFPAHAGLMTGLYSTVMSVAAGIATGLSVPMAHGLGIGWRATLAVWAIPALVALLVGWLAARRGLPVPARQERQERVRLRGSLLAWKVTGFMGLGSLLYYGLVTWLPTVLEARGMTAQDAGWMLALLQVISVVSTMAVPIIAGRIADQRGLVALGSGLVVAGFGGFWLLGTSAAAVWVVPLGIGSGAMFSLSISFLLLRASDARHTAALSSMAQAFGYLLAATGPTGLGFLFDVTGSWDPPMAALVLSSLLALGLGLGAARDVQVSDRTRPILRSDPRQGAVP